VTADLALVRLVASASGQALVTLATMDGKTLQTQTETLITGENRFEVETNTLPAGIYTLRVQTQGGTGVVKLVKCGG
jgi:hypothetical protein